MIDARVDAYIAKSAPFAQPILNEIRARVHKACPHAVETIKWSMPHFMYQDKILCGMAAFKAHCALGFWRSGTVDASAQRSGAMGDFGRLTSTKDLPAARDFSRMVKAAMAHIDSGAPRVPTQRATAPTRQDPASMVAPDDLAAAIAKSKAAQKTWQSFSWSARKDYVEWITDAKRAETRATRVLEAARWIAEGKKRHWKYEAC